VKRSKTRIAAPKVILPKALRTANNFYSPDDPSGSYTGICKDMHDKPVQDADDL